MAGDNQYLEAARKFSDIHPELYKNILQNGMSGKDGTEMIKIGLEALEKIHEMSVLRGVIALLTADYANKLNDIGTAEHCWLEAFRSDPSVENYLRLRFFYTDYKKISTTVRQIYEELRMIHKIEHPKQIDKDWKIESNQKILKRLRTNSEFLD